MRAKSVTTLNRQGTRVFGGLAQDRVPVLITEHGRPAAYLVNVKSLELRQDRLRISEDIAQGERAIEEGSALAEEQVRPRIARWLSWSGLGPRSRTRSRMKLRRTNTLHWSTACRRHSGVSLPEWGQDSWFPGMPIDASDFDFPVPEMSSDAGCPHSRPPLNPGMAQEY